MYTKSLESFTRGADSRIGICEIQRVKRFWESAKFLALAEYLEEQFGTKPNSSTISSWMLLRTSPIRRLSDSIVTDGSEMIRCEGRRDFSMSMID
jgi:hypothetical protein